jgi:hypothetical protein
MNKKPTLLRVSGLLIYLVGAVLAVTLLTLVIWPDIEASSFDSAIRADKQLQSLRCPVFITRDEIGTISITVDNPSDRDVNPTVRARITKGYRTFVQEFRQKVAVPAGGSETISWEVERKDAAYDRRMILGRFYQMRNYSLPSRTSTCGIYVLPFSGPSGQQVLIGTYATSLVLITSGLFLQLPKDRKALMRSNIESNKRQRIRLQGFAYLGGILVIGILLALIGNWLLSGALAILVATSIIAVISYALIAQ